MKPKKDDILRSLFAEVSDEALPFNFNEKVMFKIRKETAARGKRRRYWAIFGYASGIAALLAVCVFVFSCMGVSFALPEIELRAWSFPKPDFDIFDTQSFRFSLYVGILALLLLVVDSTIRRRIEKNKTSI